MNIEFLIAHEPNPDIMLRAVPGINIFSDESRAWHLRFGDVVVIDDITVLVGKRQDIRVARARLAMSGMGDRLARAGDGAPVRVRTPAFTASRTSEGE